MHKLKDGQNHRAFNLGGDYRSFEVHQDDRMTEMGNVSRVFVIKEGPNKRKTLLISEREMEKFEEVLEEEPPLTSTQQSPPSPIFL